MNLPAWPTLSLAALLASLTIAPSAFPQTAPAAPAQTNVAPTSTTSTAKKPTVEQVLASRKSVSFDFTDAKLATILTFISKNYDIDVVNNYDKDFTDLLTIKNTDPLSPREAINIVNGTLLAMGYTLLESVRGDPPRVVLTVAPTSPTAGKLIQYFYGNDPATIPENNDLRTQVFTFSAVDPTKAQNMILSVVGPQAQVTVNPASKTIIVTDTGTHVHTAARLLQTLEQQAAAEKKP